MQEQYRLFKDDEENPAVAQISACIAICENADSEETVTNVVSYGLSSMRCTHCGKLYSSDFFRKECKKGDFKHCIRCGYTFTPLKACNNEE